MANNKLKIQEMKEFLQKATFNYSIDQIKMRITKNKISSSVIGNNIITSINKSNSILTNLSDKDEVEFNIMDPMTSIRPILDLISDEEVDVIVNDEKISLKKGKFRSNIHFCDPHVIQEMNKKPKDLDINHSMIIEQDILDSINKIIKTCVKLRFKKIYFGVEKGILFIETSDRTNKFSNKLKYNLEKTNSKDFIICFSNTSISNLVKVMSKDAEDFVFKFSYLEEYGLGRIIAENKDKSEVYYLMSEKENI